MKQLFYLIIFSLFCVSCGDDDSDQGYISLDQYNVTFDPSGSSVVIQLKADGEWQVSNIPNWISTDHANGSVSVEITVTALNNENVEPRDAEIYFLRDDKKAVLKLHQLGSQRQLAWSPLCFSSFDDVSFVPGKNDSERIYSFLTTELFVNPDSKVGLVDKIFLGNLMDRSLEKNTDVSVYKGYTFNPITIFPLTGFEKSLTLMPSKLNQDSYAKQILDKKPSQSESFISDGKGVLYNSHRELNLIGIGNMGVNLEEVISNKSYQEQEMTRKNGLIYSFSHTLFTLSMDLQEHIVKEEISKADFPDNSISYISSVSYGRIGLLIIESDDDVAKIKAIVNKVLRNNAPNVTQEEATLLEGLDAYHLYYDKSQKLVVSKGKMDIIKAYKKQITDDIYNVFPFKFKVSDYFEQGDSNLSFSLTLP